MARVHSYERVVDAILVNRDPTFDTAIQNEVKIKEEPSDTTTNSDEETEDTSVKRCFSLIDHDYHRDKLSLKNDISCKDINNTENKPSSNSHSVRPNDVNKTINIERKRKKEIDNTSIQFKKQRFNQISNNENTNVSHATNNYREKKKTTTYK